jgi:prominin 1
MLFVAAAFLLAHASSSFSAQLDSENEIDTAATEALTILSKHQVVYSHAPVKTDYKSITRFNARGMQHVYTITHAFLDLVQRDDVLPKSLNASVLLDTPEQEWPAVMREHWQDIMLQYIGVLTAAACGLLFALAVPVACFCLCCCRCAGKCGAYPQHFDKKSDSCKRFSIGVLLSALVIVAMFGVVCAFVTNYYAYDGLQKLPERLRTSTEDSRQYLDNTGREVNTLFVTNYGELETVLGNILDESGPILKRSLAEVTHAVAIDDLTAIVSNLGTVKRYLKEIQTKTHLLQDKVGQLRLGLNGTRVRLLQALDRCSDSAVCREFLEEYDVGKDLAIATDYSDLPLALPDLSLIMKDISDLMNNDIENKVRGGQKQLNKVKTDIERSIGDIRPKIKAEIRKMGKYLEDQANDIQRYLNEMDSSVATVESDIPKIKPLLDEYGDYAFYIGLGMAFMVLLILLCYIFGLFYGFCGKRPGNVYGDDCCNTGTGANWLLAAVYLTFLFSCVLLLVATAQFLVGSTVDKVACEALKNPNSSEIFQLIDERFVQPMIAENHPDSADDTITLNELIANCHKNMTLYTMLKAQDIYDVEELRHWRRRYGIGDFIDNLKRKIKLDDLKDIQILSPEAERELVDLAESEISDLNFSQYTALLSEEITSIDIAKFTTRLRQVKERLTRTQARLVGPAIDNEALFLDQMQRVVMDMKLAMKDLVNSVEALEQEAKHSTPNLRESLRSLILQATKATQFLRSEGPQLVDRLTDQYVNETVGLIDDYVERVINHTRNRVGRCEPMSNSYNATVIAICNEIVDPFNGFWASIGWCLMLFLPAIALSLSLVSLYRKSEPYPGPLVERVPEESVAPVASTSQGGHAKKKKRGHRRNASEYLPDSAHYRAGYAYQHASNENRFQDISPRNSAQASVAAPVAAGPQPSTSGGTGLPRYSSNPSLDGPAGAGTEYERPPPYYYPGGDVPPPLPAPNARP